MTAYKFLSYTIFSLFLLSACSPEKQTELQSPVSPGDGTTPAITEGKKSPETAETDSYSLTISPQTAFRNTVFLAVPKNFNLSSAVVQWLINGESGQNAEGNQFKAHNVHKGDTVQARAIISGRAISSNTVTIRNSPPEISSARIIPEVFRHGDTLGIEAKGSDPDDDAVTILYEWTKNGELAGNGEKTSAQLKRGDSIIVKITPFDGEEYGNSVILRREIKNLPPMITENKQIDFDGKKYSYQVKAEDPDNDSLVYSLKTAPEGMSINPETGMITWDVPPDFKGNANLNVAVTDGHGGESTQELTLTISMPEK